MLFPLTHVFRPFILLLTNEQQQAFAEWAQDSAEREQLMRLSEQGLTVSSVSDHVTSLSLLLQYPSVRVDVGHWMELIPQLAVRYYSISSSPKVCLYCFFLFMLLVSLCACCYCVT